jgi:hypothetical protein
MLEMFAQDILGTLPTPVRAAGRALLQSPQAGLFARKSTAGSQHAFITADELVIVFGRLAGAFNTTVLFETALSQSLGETTVLTNHSVHCSPRNASRDRRRQVQHVLDRRSFL